MQKDENICSVCKAVAKQRCSSCQAVNYCSREHQKSDWKLHSKNCQPCKLAVDSRIGRHYVATRDIKVGEVVLRDNVPLVTGLYSDMPICLSCYVNLTASNARPCAKCGLPLCRSCTKHGAECEFTVKYRKSKITITDYNSGQMIFKTIGVIRGLALREANPQAYQKLLRKEDHCAARAIKPNTLDSPVEIAECIQSFFDINDIGLAEIASIAGIIQINAIGVAMLKPAYIAVYDKLSFIEHNCRPNCSRSLTIGGGVVVWAAVPIAKGEHITLSYAGYRYATMTRRCSLALEKFFDCSCERCKDPTEFETMFSVFNCFKDSCTGYMMPPTFLVTVHELPQLEFVCTKCGVTMSSSEIQTLEIRLNAKLRSMELDVIANQQFLRSRSKMLHDNHFSVVCAEIILASANAIPALINANVLERLIGDDYIKPLVLALLPSRTDLVHLSSFSNKTLTELINRCEKLINILEILQPDENRSRGVILYVLVQARAVSHNRRKTNSVEITAYLSERKQSLKIVHQLLRYEPSSSIVEYAIARAALAELEKM